ncbi:Crp/Fnr family transcriptional regulator, partial [Bradyrhizobium betae]|uniref:Crp/Fnr family transcriptional regulator n=1 Tax=Bradyrhizobium betae TaxID=244734 RepID=UPI001FE1C81C
RRAVTSDLSVWSSIDTSRSLQRDRETRLSHVPREGGSGTTLTIQLQIGGACNALHPVQARMARWLLHLRDRVDHDVLPVTQEALSQILGVRRTTVTLLMRNLRASGAIRSERRGEIEIDPSRLAAVACECRDTMRLEVEGIFSGNAALSRLLVLPKR